MYDLDDIDRALIRELQVDGRTAYSQLAPQVGMSEAAVRQRVNRLQDRGIIKVVAVTDPMRLGYGLQAMFGVKIGGGVDAAAEKISQVEGVDYTVVVTGRFDILAEAVGRDASALLDVSEQIRSVDGVQGVEVMTYLRMVQQDYDWGTA